MQSATVKILFSAMILCHSINALALDEPVVNKLPLTIFYSQQDPHWPAAQKLIESLEKEYSDYFKFERTSIDDEAGYKKLAEIEAKLNLANPGDLTVVFGSFAVVSKGNTRTAEETLPPMLKRMINPESGKGRLEADLAAYASAIFGAGVKAVEAPPDAQGLKFFSVNKGDKRIGWIVDAFRNIPCPICNDVQFFLSISVPENKLVDIKPLRELERYGRKLDDSETTGFLQKFVGNDTLSQVKPDVITGATKTSTTYARAVNEILDEVKKREAKQ